MAQGAGFTFTKKSTSSGPWKPWKPHENILLGWFMMGSIFSWLIDGKVVFILKFQGFDLLLIAENPSKPRRT